MNGIVSRFLNFDKLIGPSLIKVIYFIGLALIALGVLVFMLASLAQIGNNALAAIGGFVLGPVFGVIYLILWRFLCELYMLFFRISDDLRDIKNDRLGLTPNTTDV